MREPANDSDHTDLLARYLAGAVNSEERQSIEAKLEADPAFRAEYDRLTLVRDSAVHALLQPVAKLEVEQGWTRIQPLLADRPSRRSNVAHSHGGADAGAMSLSPPPSGRTRFRAGRRLLAILAVIAVALLVGEVARRGGVPIIALLDPVEEIVTPPENISTVSLADGSRVTLAPGSTLRVPRRFGTGTREVWLEGRAYFEVTPEPGRPFLVRAPIAVTRVVGTEFDVRAYPGLATEVAVRSGQVALRSASAREEDARTLTQGDRGVVHPEGRIEVESGIDPESVGAWTQSVLAFRNARLEEIVPELERWFDLDIRMTEPSLGQRRLTATFRDEPLDTVLATLAEVVDARVERNGRQVLFSPLR